MPKQVDAAAQRSEIRHAARRVFSRQGVEGTGLTHVAREAGMGRSSLYHYYPDKQSLLRDLVQKLLDDELEVFLGVLRGSGDPRHRVEQLARSLVALFHEYAAAFRMAADLRVRDAAQFKVFFRKVRSEFAAVIEEGQEQGVFDKGLAPALTASVLIGAIDGLLLQYFADGRAFPALDVLGEEVVRIARKALAA